MADSVGVSEGGGVEESGGLKRAIGPWLLLFFIVGDMVGVVSTRWSAKSGA